MTSEIIMRDSDEAAKPYTAQGWLSSNGHFYTDESAARYDGSTHVKCRHCGEPAKKPYIACSRCRDRLEFERYCALPTAEWDGISMLYSDTNDKYYSHIGDAYDDAEEGQDLSELRLLICKPNYVRPLEGDYCCDDLADDMDVPTAVEEAMEEFNKAVAGIVLSWSPSSVALRLEK